RKDKLKSQLRQKSYSFKARITRQMRKIKETIGNYSSEIIIAALVVIFASVFVIWFIGKEKTIYIWDYANYFYIYKDLGSRFGIDIFGAIRSIISSVRHDEYNSLPTVFLLPVYFVLGETRLAFILAISLLYSAPTILVFSNLIKNIYRPNSFFQPNNDAAVIHQPVGKNTLLLISSFFLTLLPAFWAPTMRGYLAVVGVGLIFAVIIFYLKSSLISKSYGELILIGAILALLILLRRWYAFWVVGFFVSVTLKELLFFEWRKFELTRLAIVFRHIGIIGLTSVVLFFVIAMPLALKMLGSDYDVYSAWRSSFSFRWLTIPIYHLGISVLILCLAGMITAFCRRSFRPAAFFLTANLVFTYLFFIRVQDMWIHQFFLVLPIFSMFAVICLIEIYSRLKSNASKLLFTFVFLIFSLINFSAVFVPGFDQYVGPAKFLFPIHRNYPMVRTDLDQIRSILEVLDSKTKGSTKRIYVLSATETLNAGTLVNGCRKFGSQFDSLRERFYWTSEVDKRDGFPFQFLKSDYVVLSDKERHGLSRDFERVVWQLRERIVEQKGIGKAFTRTPGSFPLQDGQNMLIYEKTRKFSASELREISDLFVGYYPELRERFEITPQMIKELSDEK
ncbi:MAG: hypothetical protein KDB79_01215, partial [Acidobacteria bacterium]|nr:hypothetical protein [Acidobacteriota bacterium]